MALTMNNLNVTCSCLREGSDGDQRAVMVEINFPAQAIGQWTRARDTPRKGYITLLGGLEFDKTEMKFGMEKKFGKLGFWEGAQLLITLHTLPSRAAMATKI